MSENRLVPVPSTNRNLDHPLHDWVQSSAPNKAQASEPTNLKDYLAVVLKYKWLILTSVVIITTLVAIKMYLTPSIYEAATTIQIEQKTHSVLQAKDIVINAAQDPNYWNTQLKLLENPQLARQVILSLDLVSDPNFTGSSSSGGGLVSKMRSAIKGKSES
jgi:polysaccharide biosynthesis transport protein